MSDSANHMNGGVKAHDSVSVCSDSSAGAATLPQYETDVNFMYLRSVLFKYLTSQDPQIVSLRCFNLSYGGLCKSLTEFVCFDRPRT